ncbi:MAG: hypothetical protein ACK5LZ_01315 [Anaerorhabdus sp.]
MKTVTFASSLITYYLKGEVNVDQNFVKFKIPNTILGLIPLGQAQRTIPSNQISSVDSSFSLSIKEVLVGVLLFFVGLSLSGDSVLWGLILMAAGVAQIIGAFNTFVLVHTTSGGTLVLDFLIFEKNKVQEVEAMINNVISGRMDDTNVRTHTEKQTSDIVDAINKK